MLKRGPSKQKAPPPEKLEKGYAMLKVGKLEMEPCKVERGLAIFKMGPAEQKEGLAMFEKVPCKVEKGWIVFVCGLSIERTTRLQLIALQLYYTISLLLQQYIQKGLQTLRLRTKGNLVRLILLNIAFLKGHVD